MSGLGRRSHYRKHLTDAVLNDFPEPNKAEGERIAKVVGTRGSNQFEIVVAPLSSACEDTCETNASHGANGGKNGDVPPLSAERAPVTAERAVQLAILPTKFRKLVWLKRNDFVIVRCGEDESGDEKTETTGSIRYQIEHILYKEQVKHLKKEGLWPEDDFFLDSTGKVGDVVDGDKAEKQSQPHRHNDEEEESDLTDAPEEEEVYGDDGIVYDGVEDFVNTNRIATLRVQDSESESESEND